MKCSFVGKPQFCRIRQLPNVDCLSRLRSRPGSRLQPHSPYLGGSVLPCVVLGSRLRISSCFPSSSFFLDGTPTEPFSRTSSIFVRSLAFILLEFLLETYSPVFLRLSRSYSRRGCHSSSQDGYLRSGKLPKKRKCSTLSNDMLQPDMMNMLELIQDRVAQRYTALSTLMQRGGRTIDSTR